MNLLVVLFLKIGLFAFLVFLVIKSNSEDRD